MNSISPLKIQLVLQGGGAKIVSLIAALEAVQQLAGRLQVCALAGASAGAIAGCLFAAGIRMEVVKAQLKSLRANAPERLFPTPSLPQACWQLLRARPLWRFQRVKAILEPLFDEAKVTTLGDLENKTGIKVLVIAADLTDAKKIVHKEAQTQILNALEDSCALPFCFRVWPKASQRVIVDGGICENLPVDDLSHDSAPIVGLSFPRTRSSAPTNFLEFSKSLLETAINNSMERSRLSVRFDKIISLDTQINTFDFTFALNEGLGTDYENVRKATKAEFEQYLADKQRSSGAVAPDAWSTQNPKMLMDLGDINKFHETTAKFHYFHAGLTLRANCMAAVGEPGYGEPDLIEYEIIFEPVDDPILFHSIAINSTAQFASQNRTIYTVMDGRDRKIPTVAVPSQDRENPTDRNLILFFSSPLRKANGPFKLRFADTVQNLLGDLATTGRDYLELFPRRSAGTINQIDLVLIYPERYAAVRMIPVAGHGSGQQMTDGDLERGKYRPPPGFKVLGWYGKDLEDLGPDRAFRVDLSVG
jgi:NTE family protein